MMRDEVVDRREWMTDAEFLDLLAATHLIPGPNSTELAIHLGYKREGLPGLLAAGTCFILPACLIVSLIAWGYTEYGDTPQVAWLTYGISPVIIAVILQAVWKLSRSAIKGIVPATIGLTVAALSLGGFNELVLLAGAGIASLAVRLFGRGMGTLCLTLFGAVAATTIAAAATLTAPAVPVTLTRLTLFFLKVGSVLFGSGYVLLAFLRADLTTRWAWLTEQQLLDAVTVGQLTPGPVFTTATFIGFILQGWPGAILATVAIFAPGFVFVAVTQPLMRRLRGSSLTSSLVDGIVAGSLGLMAVVAWHLGRSAIVDLPTLVLLSAAAVALALWRLNSTWLIVGGALAGWILRGSGA